MRMLFEPLLSAIFASRFRNRENSSPACEVERENFRFVKSRWSFYFADVRRQAMQFVRAIKKLSSSRFRIG
jgi:hypothetical protein